MAAPKHLSDLVERCIAPALAAQGFASSDIVLAWPEIVGERLARFTEPMRLEWPRRHRHMAPDERSEPATLVVRVASSFALDLQHMAPVVVERVNAHFGWRCVGRLALRQGPIARPAPRQPAPAVDEATRASVARDIGDVADDKLRAALERLGCAVLSQGRDTKA
ncbi:DUF721 domain-containing protein [Chelatococcus daeguensis]|uniref:DUF721 domain-containing protein n=1 Tax=Chelatococcus daeguensis TaxID=444444 RepID=A0AAC9NY86_9HYPH|nr:MULTISPECIES: DciA family protein [Chelatococcus]APF36878.1 hypothetical protein BOQ54_05665 [Chelatococcus daeguensis]KZE28061.1 hypothetical protein AVW15_08030 [Chelatococcus daeguensis]MBM3084635.1 DUF721 domain-containing protein [Chelatococcus daeguensis]